MGIPLRTIYDITRIDMWFLKEIEDLSKVQSRIEKHSLDSLPKELIQEAKMKGFKPGRFSFNVKGGRCESCEGDGLKKIEMHFLAPVYVKCEVCNGKRYNKETLAVQFKSKNISDILNMTVDDACDFFRKNAKHNATRIKHKPLEFY